jgi:DNA mismatch repair ATPase MutL
MSSDRRGERNVIPSPAEWQSVILWTDGQVRANESGNNSHPQRPLSLCKSGIPPHPARDDDLGLQVPARRIASKADSAASIVQTCTKLVESIILSLSSNPNTPIGGSELALTLTLEGDAAAGIPSRRILSLKSHSDLVMAFSNIFGSSLTASTKSFRASARGIHLRGFVSFTGHPTKTHQYLFVNGHRIAQSGIMDVVREVYRIANVLAQEMDEEEIGPRGGKKVVTKTQNLHPVFLLHLSLPEDEMDLGMEPLKSIVLFKVGRFSDIEL